MPYKHPQQPSLEAWNAVFSYGFDDLDALNSDKQSLLKWDKASSQTTALGSNRCRDPTLGGLSLGPGMLCFPMVS